MSCALHPVVGWQLGVSGWSLGEVGLLDESGQRYRMQVVVMVITVVREACP